MKEILYCIEVEFFDGGKMKFRNLTKSECGGFLELIKSANEIKRYDYTVFEELSDDDKKHFGIKP